MLERENLRKSLRVVQFPMAIGDRVRALRQASLPKPSSATSLSLSNAGVIKIDSHCKPSIANHLRFPELTPLISLREFSGIQEDAPSEVLAAIAGLKQALMACCNSKVDQAAKKGEDLKVETLFPYLSRIFQNECVCSVTRPNSRLFDVNSGVDIDRVDFCVYIQGLGIPVFILELKKEVKSGTKSEATTPQQAATHYLEFAKCPSVPLWTTMPCVLMSCAGTDIYTSTAVLFDCHPPMHAACIQKACSLSAEESVLAFQQAWLTIRHCVFSLTQRGISDCKACKATPAHAIDALFPAFTLLKELELRFQYTQAIARGVFHATVTEDSKCKLNHDNLIVKIVPAGDGYGELAQRLLAQWGHAPNLYGVEKIAGGGLARGSNGGPLHAS